MHTKILHNQGNHLTIDGFEADKASLDNKKLIKQTLNQIPTLLEMRKLSKPVIKKSLAKDKDRGITGFILIEESHISIHTYPEKNYLALDILSCKEFNIKETINHLKNTFKIKKLKTKLIKRGYYGKNQTN